MPLFEIFIDQCRSKVQRQFLLLLDCKYFTTLPFAFLGIFHVTKYQFFDNVLEIFNIQQ